jgi:hypothetical protein
MGSEMIFACDVLLACACPVRVEFLFAAVNALAGPPDADSSTSQELKQGSIVDT